MSVLTLTVFGVAQPKGSARAFIPKGWTRPVITSANPKNIGWQQLIAQAAAQAIADDPTFRIVSAPVALEVRFYLPRPKAIKDKRVPHIKKPDLDKLLRSVKDALTKVLWQDDAQVVFVKALKAYAEPGATPRAVISLSTKPDDVTSGLFAKGVIDEQETIEAKNQRAIETIGVIQAAARKAFSA